MGWSVALGADYELTVVRGARGAQAASTAARAGLERSAGHGDTEIAWSLPQQHCVDALRAGESPETSAADNLRTLEWVFGAYVSAATGLPYRMGESNGD